MLPTADDNKFCTNCGAQLPEGANFCHQCAVPVTIGAAAPSQQAAETPGNKGGAPTGPMPELYHVHSTVNNFQFKGIFYDNLQINWFISDRAELPAPPEQVIAGYTALNPVEQVFPENRLKEFFTPEEAGRLKAYLKVALLLSATLNRVTFPIASSEKGYRDFSAAPSVGFFNLHEKKTYNLPFKVEGIFNVGMADERIVADENPTLITTISELRKKESKK